VGNSQDLCENVVRDLFPGEALPDSKAECDCRVEMTTRRGSTGDNCEGNANSISPTDLEERAEDWLSVIQEEGCLGGNSWITEVSQRSLPYLAIAKSSFLHVEKYTKCLCSHLPHPSGPGVLKVKFLLRDWLGSNNVPIYMSSDGIRNSDFHVIGFQASCIIPRSLGRIFIVGRRHCEDCGRGELIQK
jgi:hypothetical protein